MAEHHLGVIGSAFHDMDVQAWRAHEEILAIKNEAIEFMKEWKIDGKLKKGGGRKKRPILNESADTTDEFRTSGRPARSARDVAICNIKKQSANLPRKLRRPDSDEEDENCFRSSIYYEQTKRKTTVSEKKETVSEVFAVPELPTRRKNGKKETLANISEVESRPVSVVKANIARFEEMDKQKQAESQKNSLASLKGSLRELSKTPVKVVEEAPLAPVIEETSLPKVDVSPAKVVEVEPVIPTQVDEVDTTIEVVEEAPAPEESSPFVTSTTTTVGAEDVIKTTTPVLRKTKSPSPQADRVVVRMTRSRSQSAEVVVNDTMEGISPVPFPEGHNPQQIVDESMEESTETMQDLKKKLTELESNKRDETVGPPKPKRRKAKNDSNVTLTETLNSTHEPAASEDLVGEKLTESNKNEAEVVEPPNPKKRKEKKDSNVTFNETLNTTHEPAASEDLDVTLKKRKNRKARKEFAESDIFDEPIEPSVKSTRTKTRTKRTKKGKRGSPNVSIAYDNFAPNAESSTLNIEVDPSKPSTPQNGTFVINKTRSGKRSVGEDISSDFFGSGPGTVIRPKRTKKNDTFTVEDMLGENAEEEVQFTIPMPVASKRTKVIANPKCMDIHGNLIERGEARTRTKVLDGPTLAALPEIIVSEPGERRTMRVRTKVRRYGMDEGNDPSEGGEQQREARQSSSSSGGAPARSTRTKTKTTRKSSENEPKVNLKTIVKSKVRRMSNLKTLSKLLVSSDKKYKTPLSTVTNLHGKRGIVIMSATKTNPMSQRKRQLEGTVATVVPRPGEDQLHDEREAKLKTKQHKEEQAAVKKLEEINRKREVLKQKNEEKLQKAMKCRAKLEEEKYEQIVQTEKEKEMKRRMLLQEREQKQKAEQSKKKMMTEKKLADHEERRRLEEEARKAKIREMEAEQQRQIQEKQRQIEYEEKRAKERLEEKKRMAEADKMMKQKIAQAKVAAAKAEQSVNYLGKYLPRNDDDLGLEDELSENSDSEEPPTPDRRKPSWVEGAKKGNPAMKYLTEKQLSLFMPLRSKTPNIHKMFNMPPEKQLRRTSSAIWNASMSTSLCN